MPQTRLSHAHTEHATPAEAAHLASILQRMVSMFQIDRLDRYLALRAEAEHFYGILRNRALQAEAEAESLRVPSRR